MDWLSGTLTEIKITQKKRFTQQQGTGDRREGSGARDLGMAQPDGNQIEGKAGGMTAYIRKKLLDSVASNGSART